MYLIAKEAPLETVGPVTALNVPERAFEISGTSALHSPLTTRGLPRTSRPDKLLLPVAVSFRTWFRSATPPLHVARPNHESTAAEVQGAARGDSDRAGIFEGALVVRGAFPGITAATCRLPMPDSEALAPLESKTSPPPPSDG